MMKRLIIIQCIFLSLYLTTGKANGQNSMFEDAAGEGAIKLENSKVTYNTGDNSIKFNFQQYNGVGLGGFGINVNFQANNGISELLSEGEFDPAGTIGLFYTKYDIFSRNKISVIDFINISGSILGESATLLDTANLQLGTQQNSTLGLRAELTYNRIGYLGKSQSGADENDSTCNFNNTLWGIGISLVNSDNTNSISTQKFNVLTTNFTSANQQVTQSSELSGFNIQEYNADVTTFNANFDWAIQPRFMDCRIWFATHFRGRSVDWQKFVLNAGVGVYLAERNNSTGIIGGINFMANDLGTISSLNNAIDRLQINLVAGFNLN